MPHTQSSRPNITAIIGASGTGKGRLIKRLLVDHPDIFLSVSYTTRPLRRGETEGIEYCYVSRETFMDMIARNEFLEHAEVYGDLYGTPRPPIDAALTDGRNVVLEIDPQGARKMLAVFPDAVTIFVDAPSSEEVERRLIARGDDLSTVRRRMAKYPAIRDTRHEFMYIVMNDDVDVAYAKLRRLITSQQS